MHTLSQIRQCFLDYFKNNQHQLVQSSSLIPENDPTLLFTNAGMVQFKNIFTGQEQPIYKKAVTSQKCLRAGGKHNDLENVGYTARHHTFFEMLGNFSFGDYFKDEAIAMAWELVTKHFCIDPKKLLVTVYAEDDEAYRIWKKITHFSDDKIIRINTNDNFWSMGNTGPCGPCTEIFYDHGESVFGDVPGSKDQDGDRFTEIWNLVFMQYNQQENGERVLLPKPSIDTGMGLERMSSVLQGVHNNYDTDLFQHIIRNVQALTNNTGSIYSYRVIADHLRAISFMISDGILPSNEGRGYVLRRIMRRAMRHVHMMNPNDVLMHLFVPFLNDVMGDVYPELKINQTLIQKTLQQEEERFKETLEKGLKLLQDEKKNIHNNVLPGSVAFKLYDTYGFPLDLTEDILKADHIFVDKDGFEHEMNAQKGRARRAWKGSGDEKEEAIFFELKERYEPTQFLGYDQLECSAHILEIISDGQLIENAQQNDLVYIITNQTTFYAEAGGQIGDNGFIQGDDFQLVVIGAQKKVDHFIVHKCVVETGIVRKGQKALFHVLQEKRQKIAANHSATHLLHKVLRDELGEHVVQKGSLVTEEKLRFDFSHAQALTQDEIERIEKKVNDYILENSPRTTTIMPYEQAIQEGAMALFGEKYTSDVRVVSFGKSQKSVELCGGTHVVATGDIGLFKIVSEVGIAAGIRRIEALTGYNVLNYIKELEKNNEQFQISLREETLSLKKKIDYLEQRNMLLSINSVDEEKNKDGVIWGIKSLHNVKPTDLRLIADKLLSSYEGILLLTNVVDEKLSVAVAVSKTLTQKLKASDLIKVATQHLGGQGGGGKADFAQGGGLDESKIPTLLDVMMKSF